MAAGQNQSVQVNDFESIRARVSEIFEVGIGDSGYGQTSALSNLPPVETGTVIQLNYWLALRQDMVRARQHQTGIAVQSKKPTDVGYVEGRDLITPTNSQGDYPVLTEELRNQYSNFANVLLANKFEIGPTQQVEMTAIPPRSRTTAWNGTITHTVTYAGVSNKVNEAERIAEQANNIRHFFNAGGSLKINASRGGGAATTRNQEWTDLLSSIGDIIINHNNTTNEKIVAAGSFVPGKSYTIVNVGNTDFTLIGAAINSVGQTFTATGIGTGVGTAKLNEVFAGTGQAKGWYNLTENYQTLFEAGSTDDRLYKVSARKDVNSTRIEVKIEFSNNSSVNPTNIDGTLLSYASYFRPFGVNVDVPELVVTHTGFDEAIAPDPDLAPPTIQSIGIVSDAGSDKTYTTDDVVTVEVTFSEPIRVSTGTGTPMVGITVGTVPKDSTYSYTNGSKAYFNYTVVQGDEDPNGISIPPNSISFNGGRITDLSGNTAILDYPGTTDNANHLVDTTPPVLDSSYYTLETDQFKSAEFNIMLIIDTSLSMRTNMTFESSTIMRLEAAKTAAKYILDQYASQGTVSVRLITYSSTSAAVGSIWTPVSVAKDQINSLVPISGSNANSALDAARAAFLNPGKLTNGNNICYFISDSQISVTGQPLENWLSFLQTYDVVSYALGFADSVNLNNINPVAYNGVNSTDLNGVAVNSTTSIDPYILTYYYQPIAGSQNRSVNVMIIIDTSGSMGSNTVYNSLTMSRLTAAKTAANYILDQYESIGDAKIRLITFSSSATAIESTWLDIPTARTKINLITSASGTTNEDTALTLAQTAWQSPGKLADSITRNVCYFLTDAYRFVNYTTYDSHYDRHYRLDNNGYYYYNKYGVKQYYTNRIEFSDPTLTQWESFLKANAIISYGVGIDDETYQSSLDQISFDGESNFNLGGYRANSNPEIDPIILQPIFSVIPTPSDPTIIKSGIIVSGNIITLKYADVSFLDSINIPPTTAFSVKIDRSGQIIEPEVLSVSVANNADRTVTLTIPSASAARYGDIVSVSYTRPNAINAIQDVIGNDAANLVDVVAINATIELVYSKIKFSETTSNNGSITETSTITIIGNGIFADNIAGAIPGVTFSNVPAGLTGKVTKTGAKTAVLSFTGSATNHEVQDSVSNITVTFSNSSFGPGIVASTVTNYFRSDLSIEFVNPAVNLMLIFDISGSASSVQTTYKGTPTNTIESSKLAAKYLLSKYSALGVTNVCVMSVNNQDFDSTKYKWTNSVNLADTYIDDIRSLDANTTPNGTVSTVYNDPLRISGTRNTIIYFFTDSTHSQSTTKSIFGFSGTNATPWRSFVDAQGIISYGVYVASARYETQAAVTNIGRNGRLVTPANIPVSVIEDPTIEATLDSWIATSIQ